ncbi:MAG TPA: MATE family efflux transporter, partial [Acidimicrobiales bacterium]|nr:MATE family efflux transporter [Acidimicrobiales bacterium]
DREILRLALPALGALVAEPLYILCDTAVVGHLGTDQLGGLAVASSILLLLYSIFIFLAYGTTAAVARLLGAGEPGEAAHQAVQGMWLAFLIGLVLIVIGLVAAEPLVHALGATGAVAAYALLFLRISLLGIPAQLVVLAGTGYLRGLQDTRTPLVVSVVSAAGNLALEVALIYGLGFGLGASAVSTVLAQVGSAVVYVVWVRRAVRHHEVRLAPHGPTLRRLAVVGGDLFVRTAALRGVLVVATAVATRLGTVALAAHQIAFQVWNLLALCLDAVAIAGQALIGRFLGADDVATARAAGRRMLEWGVAAGIVFGLVTFALRSVLPRVFTADPAVISVTSFVLVFVAAMQPVNGVAFVLDGLLIGAGDLRFLAVAMVGAAVVFAFAAAAVLALGLGIGWLWTAIGLFMVARTIGLGVRWHGDRWAVTGAVR